MWEALLATVTQLNTNKLFWGITMIMMNLGSRYVIADLNKIYENVLMMEVVKKAVLFCMFFVACRDIMVSIALTFGFSIVFQALLNAKSRYNILPAPIKALVLASSNKLVSKEDYQNALEVVARYEIDKAKTVEQFSRSESAEMVQRYKSLLASVRGGEI